MRGVYLESLRQQAQRIEWKECATVSVDLKVISP